MQSKTHRKMSITSQEPSKIKLSMQLAICIGKNHKKKQELREDFLTFIDCFKALKWIVKLIHLQAWISRE